MANCSGKRKNDQTCNSSLYKCKKCGNVGCAKNSTAECSNQAFLESGKCLKCSTSGQKEFFR